MVWRGLEDGGLRVAIDLETESGGRARKDVILVIWEGICDSWRGGDLNWEKMARGREERD